MKKFFFFLIIATLVIVAIVNITGSADGYTLTQTCNGCGAQTAFEVVKSALGQ